MTSLVTGLIASEGQELVCADCGKLITHPKEYVSISEKKGSERNLCVKCAGKEGYLWIAGLIVTGELVCDGCSKTMRHPERYGYIGYIRDEGMSPLRLCEECSRARGYLEKKIDDRGREVETFL